MPLIPLGDNRLNLTEEPGIEGMFTRDRAPGALPNGTRIKKGLTEPGDETPSGMGGEILGSVGPIPFKGNPEVFGYFVLWDNKPGRAVFTVSLKIEEEV